MSQLNPARFRPLEFWECLTFVWQLCLSVRKSSVLAPEILYYLVGNLDTPGIFMGAMSAVWEV